MRKLIVAVAIVGVAAGAAFVVSGGAGADDRMVPRVGLSADEADRLLADAQRAVTDEQAAALRDGTVDRAEYEAAAAKSAACFEAGLADVARETGVAFETTVRPPEWSADGFRLDYSVAVAFPEGVPDDVAARLRDRPTQIDVGCQQRYVDAIRRTYQIAFLADASKVAAIESAFRNCLAGRGLALEGDDVRQGLSEKWDELREAGDIEPVRDCLAQYPSVGEDPRFG
ncbi:MAG TPA: hypothetical protein VF183_09665 [Acidimicrobiales bacterium]